MPIRTPQNKTALGTTNGTSLTTTVTTLSLLEFTNYAAYTVFFKIYDKASAPTVGTDTPILTIPIPTVSSLTKEWKTGLTLTNGFAYAITKAIADTDTTALTAGDCKVHAEYEV